MKKKPVYYVLLITCIYSFSALAQIATIDRTKPITIDSDYQNIDMIKDTMTFTGNVIIVQDTLHLHANSVLVEHAKSKKNKRIIALGTPVTIQQQGNKDQKIDGIADKVVYDVKENEITLLGNARFTQNDNTIYSQRLKYNISGQQILADGLHKERVKTMLFPQQLKQSKD